MGHHEEFVPEKRSRRREKFGNSVRAPRPEVTFSVIEPAWRRKRAARRSATPAAPDAGPRTRGHPAGRHLRGGHGLAAERGRRRRRHRRPLHSDHAAQRGLRRVDLREDARVPLLWRPHPDREQRPRGRTLTPVDTAAALASGSTARPALPQPWARALPYLLGSGPSPLVLGSVASPFEATPQPSKGRPRICAPTRSHVRCI